MKRWLLYDVDNDQCFTPELFKSYSEAEDSIDPRWNDVLIVPIDVPGDDIDLEELLNMSDDDLAR